ncbi:MFS transporter [Spirillospora albida]|uniref:MFS transporter n=1 Tax=Spirillospora albida TaxID=58123 RepID=UPI000A6B09E7|nr:MFS transporter [Spirillospora albida]
MTRGESGGARTAAGGAGAPPVRQVVRLRAARAAVGAFFFASGAASATWAARVPAVRDALALTPGGLATALTGLAAGAVAGLPLAGLLVSRWGSRRVLGAAVLYLSVLPVIAAAPRLWCLTGALFAFAVGNSIVDVAMNTQGALAERAGSRPVMGGLHARLSLGGVVGAAAGGFAAMAGLATAVHFLMIALVLSTVCAVAAAFLLPDEPGAPQPRLGLPTRGLWIPGLITFCALMGEGMMNNWGSVYLRDVAGASPWIAAVGFAVFSAGMVTGRLAADRIRGRITPGAFLLGCAMLAVTGALTAIGLPSRWTALTGYALIGLGLSAIVPVTFSRVALREPHEPGPAIAAVSTVGYLGFLAGPPIVGLLAEAAGLRAVMLIMLALMVTVICLAARLR